MIQVSATTQVRRTSREVLEFVADLDRYREVDRKIGRISRPLVLDHTGTGRVRYWGRLRGLPPAPDVNLVRLTPWTELTFTGAPWQPARLALDFRGRFRCADTDNGCTVTHDYELAFRPPFRWFYEARLADWLQTEVTHEVASLATVLSPSTGTSATGRSAPHCP